jgi:BirA family biotin operon repressor/biotin-[acetyl-CoA-carboxylase] ligase
LSSQFDDSLFRQKLTSQWLGHSFCYFEELESTNTYLKKLPADEVKQGMICLTDNQTRGRGQYERNWQSAPEKNLTFSLAFLPSSAERFHVLTLACALALVEELNDFGRDNSTVCIKWPNDVLYNDKKIAGLLTETVFNGNKFDRLVIGIGLNVNQKIFSDELKETATSIRKETGKRINREGFLSELLNRIEYKYNLWQRQEQDLLKSINRNVRGYGQWIGLKVDGEMREDTYKLLGIDETGQLLMLNHDGGIEKFSYEQIRLVTD